MEGGPGEVLYYPRKMEMANVSTTRLGHTPVKSWEVIHAGSHAGSSTDDGVRGVPKGLDSPMGTTRCRRSPGTVPERVNALARVQGAA